ncbi:MAG: SDR family NAD(P)-dependent oxidoreductase, partial [Steroidobacter sp.]
TERARRRASAEEITRVWCHEHDVRRVVLRVPAIYGPGRLPLERLQKGEPAIIESESPIINRIHVDDLVQTCIAVGSKDDARGIYNVSDGNSLTMTAYLNRVATLANLPAPSQITLEHAHLTLDTVMLSYLDESRRISNSRMTDELGIKLKYADVDEGIRASLAEEAASNERRGKRK